MSDRYVAFGRLPLITEKRLLGLVFVAFGRPQIPAARSEIVALSCLNPGKTAALFPQRGQPRQQVLPFDVSAAVFHGFRTKGDQVSGNFDGRRIPFV